jgi:uncharacterized protein with HEPN domain/predicted nucleotidyltransferase
MERPMIADIASHSEELRELCRQFHVRRLDLFGSATGEDFDAERSDLDFLVEFDLRAPEALSLKTFFGLKESLEKLFGRSVDLVEPGAIRNPYLKASIERSRESSLRRDPKSLLWDARDAAKAIADMTAGKSFSDFDSDLVLRSAVERQFEILGEALAQLARLDPTLAARIPDLRQIVAFRNVLIHRYARIDRARVWRAVEDDLPPLRAILKDLLAGQ